MKNNWINVKDNLPSIKNGEIDRYVLIAVKNKNKPDGIWLKDICWFNGESWGERQHTWEEILYWKSLKNDNPE